MRAPGNPARVILAHALLAALFLAIVVPGIRMDQPTTTKAWDQQYAHLPLVERFVASGVPREAYPTRAATTPGYHLFLAWVSSTFAHGQVGPHVWALRATNALLGLALIYLCWWWFYRGGCAGAAGATWLTLPILLSYNFLADSIWIMTDNGALLWACAAWWIVISSRRGALPLLASGLFAGLGVAWRQVQLWVVAPLVWRMYSGGDWRARPLACLVSLAMPASILGYFVWLWGGLMPSDTRQFNGGGNPAVPLYIVSLFGAISLFFIGYLMPVLRDLRRTGGLRPLLISLLVGLAAAIVFPTLGTAHSGRWGGALWVASRHLPHLHQRSLVFLVLCPLGSGFLYLWYRATPERERSLLAAGLLAWTAANTLSFLVFQRYYETMLLIVAALLASRQRAPHPRSALGPAVLAGVGGALSVYRIFWGAV